MDLALSGKRVLISGGTSGIGLSAAKSFLREGASVVLMGRSNERGKAAEEQLLQSGAPSEVFFVTGDVSKKADCQNAVRVAERRLGGLDILVNGAGIYYEGAHTEISEEELRLLMDTNVMGTMLLTQAALPALEKSQGNIVNVASDAGLHGNYFAAAYCATKGAVVLFTRAMALELAGLGIRVNAVAPGDILTEMTERQLQSSPLSRQEALSEMASVYPLGRIGTPEEAADLIVFLASARAGFVTGSVYCVDGGLTA